LAELAESGVYVTVRVSLPVESEFAGTLIVALPLLSVAEIAELNPPPLRATLPVGVGVPLTVTVAVSAWLTKIVDADRLTAIVGAGGAFTVTEPVPDEVLYAAELAESGV
jgi:hypothetical protein